ncbi:MAG: branched-chain amino acid ABC transporter permease [Alphaproteobacteria bacterium]|nr:branched-chain amino acid ABC transporter permease [Alphaproteobacteria bacterium]
MRATPRLVAIAICLIVLAIVPPVATAMGEPYYLRLFERIMIFAIAAISLDLILGYGGMVSFGHAAYLGIGGYAVAIFSYYGVGSGWVHFPVTIVGSALIALFIGAISLRTSGMYFIMITLAFTQMLYFLGVSLEEYGGDDGINTDRSGFAKLIDLYDPWTLYYFTFGWLLLCLLISWRLVNSRFGMVIRGAFSNETRMQAIGFPTYRYKLAAFAIAGAMCGVAGALLANITEFVTPEYMHWFRSGEIMVMVLLGGMGTLFGPLLGAAVFLLLEEVLKEVTQHWQIIFGPLFVILVLFARRGLWGLIPDREDRDG